MLAAIDLDDQPCLGAIEIDDEVADGFLPTKLEAVKLFSP
jgi:hypothetical protein